MHTHSFHSKMHSSSFPHLLRTALAALSLLACAAVSAAPRVDAVSATLSKSETGAAAANLSVQASDPASKTLEIVFHGRRQSDAGEDFSIVLLPDTQCYTQEIKGGAMKMFEEQIKWILLNAKKQNIAFVLHLGDITQDGDRLGELEWQRAGPGALHKLEKPELSGLPGGVPYCVCVGNHDTRHTDDTKARSVQFNKYFGTAHFKGKSYYGGSYKKSSNNSHYMLFNGGSEKFIVVSLAYAAARKDPNTLAWAKKLLDKHSDRRAIIVTHAALRPGLQQPLLPDGQAIHDALKECKNFMFLIGGHITGEGRRKDVYDGRVVYSFVKDFQGWEDGGSGYLGILTLSPRTNKITGKTYSPYLNKWSPGGDSNFTLDYDFGTKTTNSDFKEIGRHTAQSGETIKCVWPDLELGASYEWHAEVRAGKKSIRTAPQGFKLRPATPAASATPAATPNSP